VKALSFGQFCTFKVSCPCESVSFSCLLYTQSLSLYVAPPDTDNHHGQWWRNFGSFCSFKVTCPSEPVVSFSCLLYTQSLSLSLSVYMAPPDTDDHHGQWLPNFSSFSSFEVTSPCEPVGFSRLLYAMCYPLLFQSVSTS
jgi:hypothetical protein